MTGRRIALGLAALAGVLFGALVTVGLNGPAPAPGSETPPTVAGESGTAVPPTTTTVAPTTTEPLPPGPPVLLAWTAGALPSGLGDAAPDLPGVRAATVVRGGQADLVRTTDVDGVVVDQPAEGWAIPLDVVAVDPAAFPPFADPADRAAIAELGAGEALLTASSAELRRLGVGATLTLTTGDVTVAGVISDRSGSGAELVLPAADAAHHNVATERFVLLEHEEGVRDELSSRLADLAGGRAIRFRTPRETDWMRHGDAVAPQVHIKAAYGEFAYRDLAGRSIEVDPAWVDEHIVTAEVPTLGEVRCHRDAVEPLRQVLTELAETNRGHLVDPAGYAGCWSPRRISSTQPISRHAWGIAVDLNIGANPRGSFSTQDPMLVELMRSAGFTWGGTWLVPDPGHYELVPDG